MALLTIWLAYVLLVLLNVDLYANKSEQYKKYLCEPKVKKTIYSTFMAANYVSNIVRKVVKAGTRSE